jgi:preprotein translocase subunit SecD
MSWDGSWSVEKCDLSADPNDQHSFRVDVTVDSHGSELLRKLSPANQGERLAVIVEERIVFAPRIWSVIDDSFSIKGSFTKAEAEHLVNAIRRGIKTSDYKSE